MKIKNLLIVIVFLNSIVLSQSFEITNIIDNNLFELESGKRVKFYGLYIPSLNDTNISTLNLAKKILKWEENFLLNRDFEFNFIGEDSTGNLEAEIIKNRPFYKENMAEKLLSNGYAVLLENNDKSLNSNLIKFQESAENKKYGIWQDDVSFFNPITSPIVKSKIKAPFFKTTKERPYLPLLAISVASFALAWDSFASASDIQKTIDLQKELFNDPDISELKSSKSRKSIVGVTCLIAGVITTFYSFQSVEIRTDFQSISFNYKF